MTAMAPEAIDPFTANIRIQTDARYPRLKPKILTPPLKAHPVAQSAYANTTRAMKMTVLACCSEPTQRVQYPSIKEYNRNIPLTRRLRSFQYIIFLI